MSFLPTSFFIQCDNLSQEVKTIEKKTEKKFKKQLKEQKEYFTVTIQLFIPFLKFIE